MKKESAKALSKFFQQDSNIGLILLKANDTLNQYNEFNKTLVNNDSPKIVKNNNCILKKIVKSKNSTHLLKKQIDRENLRLPSLLSKTKNESISKSKPTLNKAFIRTIKSNKNIEKKLNIENTQTQNSFISNEINDKNDYFIKKNQYKASKFKFDSSSANNFQSTITINKGTNSFNASSNFTNIIDDKKFNSNQVLVDYEKNDSLVANKIKSRYRRNIKAEIDFKFKDFKSQIEESNLSIKGLIKKYEKKKEELSCEKKMWINDNKSFERKVVIFNEHKGNKKKGFISLSNKNNKFEQSEYIVNTNPEAIYKFRSLIFEKNAKSFINDNYILKK